jgi:hypothetical protein
VTFLSACGPDEGNVSLRVEGAHFGPDAEVSLVLSNGSFTEIGYGVGFCEAVLERETTPGGLWGEASCEGAGSTCGFELPLYVVNARGEVRGTSTLEGCEPGTYRFTLEVSEARGTGGELRSFFVSSAPFEVTAGPAAE